MNRNLLWSSRFIHSIIKKLIFILLLSLIYSYPFFRSIYLRVYRILFILLRCEPVTVFTAKIIFWYVWNLNQYLQYPAICRLCWAFCYVFFPREWNKNLKLYHEFLFLKGVCRFCTCKKKFKYLYCYSVKAERSNVC